MKAPKSRKDNICRYPLAFFLIGLLMASVSAHHASGATAKVKQRTFASPEEAVKALVDAVGKNDKVEMSAVFGAGPESVIFPGDETTDKAFRERFLKAFAEKNSLEKKTEDKVILGVGNDNWLFPIPIVRKGSVWRFDTKAGEEEILDRRIGANELRTIEVLHAYVTAQREYASKDWDGDGVYPYAQRIASTPGKKDGLYWKPGEGEEASPLGPFAAEAAQEGYAGKAGGNKPVPYRGYYYRILKAQGKNAPGGSYDYVVKGKMIFGFAMVAYPAKYGSSGIMTFIVNQEGVVYQKDLGKNTPKVATAMMRYNPDDTWKKVEEPAEK